MSRLRFRLVLLGGLVLWAAAVAVGFGRLLEYASTPGATGAAPASWPADSPLRPDPDRANLVLFVHPRCPCSRATLDELERLMTRCHGLVTAHVLCYRPAGVPEGWERTDLWERASAVPDVRVLPDEGGALARLFGTATSGQALLYDRDGRLLFRGGLTNSRGHAGPGAGTEAVIELLTTGAAGRTQTPVFGCPLSEPCSPETQGGPSCPR